MSCVGTTEEEEGEWVAIRDESTKTEEGERKKET
jgi:hypothetical protein